MNILNPKFLFIYLLLLFMFIIHVIILFVNFTCNVIVDFPNASTATRIEYFEFQISVLK